MTDTKNFDIESIKNKNVFKVPDNYFDTIADRVMARIDDGNAKVISIQTNNHHSAWIKWSSIAACIAMAIVGTTYLGYNLNTTDTNTAELSGTEIMSQEDMLEYSMIDRNDVYCYLADEY